ncbi:glutamate--tRNA ligase [Candidatus Parcubacteria bacterium]|nr:MAG: glutamate--tRNA ligase [Candidatus Parcubacteria bacterium]
MNVRVRFPPSPTGFCHVGTARMAILNYLFAKKHGGTIIFRSEDTDKVRSKREYEEDIIEQLKWLGLSWDEFYRTTELVESHKEALARLIAEDKAYVSKEESKKEPGVRVEVVRLRNPGKKITFTDLIRGDITFDTAELGDFTIARAIDDPLYHLAVVVDDGEMGITHVIRGEDHISNTPRQILIQEALGYPRPEYAHYPLHLGTDKSKLSKRTGDVAVKSYRERGFLPEALLNYIAILGWTPPSAREVLSLREMIEEFEIGDLHKSGAVFDIEKLRWFNRQYLLKEPESSFAHEAITIMKSELSARSISWDEAAGERIMPLVRERISVWQDLRTLIGEGEFDFFFAAPAPEPSTIPGKGNDAGTARKHLQHVQKIFDEIPSAEWNETRLKDSVWDYATNEGRAAVLWPLRYALTGKERSPDPFLVGAAIGKDAVLKRIEAALSLLTSKA